MEEISEHSLTSMRRIRRLSLFMQGIIVLGAVLAEIGLAWVWLSPTLVDAVVLHQLQLSPADVMLDGRTRFVGFLICSVPLLVVAYGLYHAFILFNDFRRGLVFTDDTAARLRHIALAVIGAVLMSPLVQGALSAALTYGAPEGKRQIVISFSIDDYLVATLGGLLLAIAFVMAEAVRIAKENREII